MDADSLLLSTRGADAGGLPSHPAIGASDAWTIEFAPEFFAPATSNPAPLVERISDVLLVITVRGKRA